MRSSHMGILPNTPTRLPALDLTALVSLFAEAFLHAFGFRSALTIVPNRMLLEDGNLLISLLHRSVWCEDDVGQDVLVYRDVLLFRGSSVTKCQDRVELCFCLRRSHQIWLSNTLFSVPDSRNRHSSQLYRKGIPL